MSAEMDSDMNSDMNSMGPVDYLVVEFPDARVTGNALPRLVDLVDRGVVRILDLDGDGELDLRIFEGAASGLVGRDDLDEAAAVIAPGSAAAIVVYENVWAIPFASALRRAGAELVASGRVPVNALLDALDAVEVTAPVDA